MLILKLDNTVSEAESQSFPVINPHQNLTPLIFFFFFSCNHKATTTGVWVVRDGLPSQLPWRPHPGSGLVLALWWVPWVGKGWGPHVWDGQRYSGDLKMLSLGVERRKRLLPSGGRNQGAKGGAFRWGRPTSQQPRTASPTLETSTFSPDAAGSQ